MTKAEIEKRINEIQQELDSLKAQLNEPEQTGWEKPTIDDDYWYIGADNCICHCCWSNSSIDNARYDSGNCFTSEKLAANVSVYKSLDSRIRRRIAEICEPVGWNDSDQEMFEIVYDADRKHLDVYSSYTIRGAGWYCDTKEHAEQIIEEFKDELTWYFTEFKDRMDG